MLNIRKENTMIDKKGKLFGKVSIIDLFVVAAIVVAAVFMQRNMGVAAIITGDRGEPLHISLYVESVVEDIANNLRVGAPVIDWDRRVELGRITSYEVTDGFEWIPNQYGILVKAYRPGFKSIIIEASGRGIITDTGVNIDGNRYSIGAGLSIVAGDTLMFMRISGIERGGLR